MVPTYFTPSAPNSSHSFLLGHICSTGRAACSDIKFLSGTSLANFFSKIADYLTAALALKERNYILCFLHSWNAFSSDFLHGEAELEACLRWQLNLRLSSTLSNDDTPKRIYWLLRWLYMKTLRCDDNRRLDWKALETICTYTRLLGYFAHSEHKLSGMDDFISNENNLIADEHTRNYI